MRTVERPASTSKALRPWRHRWSARSQRGAALVEAALVLPVMIAIVMGIMEFGLLFTTHSTTTASSRSGARLGATSYAPAVTTMTQDLAAEQIAASTGADLQVLNNAVPVGMTIYRVDPGSTNGAPTGGFPGANMSGGCSSRCIRYTWDAGDKEMKRVSGSWNDPDACGVIVDSIGVFVQTEHDFITGMFGAKRHVGGHTVMRLEPLPTDQCSGESPVG